MRIKRGDLHKTLGNLPTQSKCIIDLSYYHFVLKIESRKKYSEMQRVGPWKLKLHKFKY